MKGNTLHHYAPKQRVLLGFDRTLEQVPIPVLQIDSINGLRVSSYESGSAASDSFTMASLGSIHQSKLPSMIFKCLPINMLLKVFLNSTTHRHVSVVLCLNSLQLIVIPSKSPLQNACIQQIPSCNWTSSQHNIYGRLLDRQAIWRGFLHSLIIYCRQKLVL